jgi:hypothetical protein
VFGTFYVWGASSWGQAVRTAPRHPWLVDPARPSMGRSFGRFDEIPISSKRHPPSPSSGDGEAGARGRLASRTPSVATSLWRRLLLESRFTAYLRSLNPLGSYAAEPPRGVCPHCAPRALEKRCASVP